MFIWVSLRLYKKVKKKILINFLIYSLFCAFCLSAMALTDYQLKKKLPQKQNWYNK